MTYKETRWNLAIKYYDKLRKADKTLDFLTKCRCPKEKIQLIREILISNLQEGLKKEEGYEVAKDAHRAELKAKEDKWLEDLKWDKDGILNALKENPKYIKIEENAEVMWYNWKKVHINLPKVWKFEWYKFDYFVSDFSLTKKNFEKNHELEKKSYSMNDVSNLLKAMNEFMAALECKTDWDMKYESELRYWERDTWRCYAWEYLKAITWLNSWYWLSDKEEWRYHVLWILTMIECYFYPNDINYCDGRLFLRLSD